MKKKRLAFKLLLLMRMTMIQMALMLGALCSLKANDLHGQEILDKPVRITAQKSSIQKVIERLENQTGVDIVYSSNIIEATRKVLFNSSNINLGQFLEQSFAPLGIGYRVVKDHIVLFHVKPENRGQSAEAQREEEKREALEPIGIRGTIRDNKGEPLVGATISLKGSANVTTSDDKGGFLIKVPEGKGVLVISYAGFATQEVTLGQQTELNIVMTTLDAKLGDVVVIGYGSQKKAKVTGAIGSVTSKDFNGVAVTGLDQALQGQISGVQVTQNSGEPGGSTSIRIRGVGSINQTNEPLYVVDGVPYGSLNAINPNDIDRIDVLKDAAAASIYGSRASNGVVLVTTKHAKKGLTISLDGYAGVQHVAKKLKLLNGPQFAQLANENLTNGGIAANPAWSNPSTVPDNDWQSAVFQTAPIQNYTVSVASGGERSSSLFSFGYFDQGGILVGSDYQRYTARLNTDYTVSKRLKVGIVLNGAFDKKQNVVSASNFAGVLNNATNMQPTSLIKTPQNGLFSLNPDGTIDATGNTYYGWNGYAFTTKYPNVNYYPGGLDNPLYTKKYYLKNPSQTQQILASAFAELEVIQGLKVKSTMNLTYGHTYTENSRGAAPDAINLIGQFNSLPSYSEYWDQSNQWNWVNTLAYGRTFGKHTIGAVAGIDAQKFNTRFVNVSTTGAPADQQSINASDGSAGARVTTGYPSDYALLSYFGRLSYDYAGKYLFSGTIRRDGSSNFGPANQYGVFESASAGWRVSEEEFMKSVTAISDLKIRASYGTVGNQNIPSFKYLTTYSTDAGTYQYTLGPNQSPNVATYANNIGDPNIHWEKSTQADLGLDLSVLQGKLSLTADYYIKKLSDLLGYFPVPAYTGVYGNSVLRNGFSMENKGLELALTYNQQIGSVNFSISPNFSTLDNKITKLTDNSKTYVTQSISLTAHDGGAITQTKVGGRIGTFLGYLTDGIAQTTAEAAASPVGGLSAGDRMYKDLNKDGIIDANDKVALGNGLPKYTFGLNLRADYKGWDLAVLLNGQSGVQIANMMRGNLYDMRYYNSTGIVNGSADLMNRWTGAGTSNTMPRNAYTAPTSNDWFSNVYIENGSFLRVRNVQLGYTFRESMTKKAGISHARFYIAAQNLHTFTKYTGYDPEVGSPGQSVLQTGADYGRYPLARMFTAGFNCQF